MNWTIRSSRFYINNHEWWEVKGNNKHKLSHEIKRYSQAFKLWTFKCVKLKLILNYTGMNFHYRDISASSSFRRLCSLASPILETFKHLCSSIYFAKTSQNHTSTQSTHIHSQVNVQLCNRATSHTRLFLEWNGKEWQKAGPAKSWENWMGNKVFIHFPRI